MIKSIQMHIHKLTLTIIIGVCFACQPNESSQGNTFLEKVDGNTLGIQDDSLSLLFFNNPAKAQISKYSPVYGSVTPTGWMKDLMIEDLNQGVVGYLDQLFPGINNDDPYNTKQRGGFEDMPDMGDLVLTGAAWEKSIFWWNAETTGNWWDGFVRHAYLCGDKSIQNKAKAIVEHLLEAQEEDGYIGIYKPNLRYQHEGANGELWAQTTACRTLLGYYTLTKDKRALDAVEKAMALTMEKYGPTGNNPFYLKDSFGGVTHGLMLTDVLEQLYQLTNNKAYQDYAVYLYYSFCRYPLNDAFNDLRYSKLVDRDSLFTGHAVHVYEHFRSLALAYQYTTYPELKAALDNGLSKLDVAMLPSGAGQGNEWLAGAVADPNYTAAEYCSMLELRNSLSMLGRTLDDVEFYEAAEKLTFNAMLGSRFPGGQSICYGKLDNCTVLDGKHHGQEDVTDDIRYKYSPTHSEPAVCCVPNYGRSMPYYLEEMWTQGADGLSLNMFGPSILNTSFDGQSIQIHQITNYPIGDTIKLIVQAETSSPLQLRVRIPVWASQDFEVLSAQQTTVENGYLLFNKLWNPMEEVILVFPSEANWVSFDAASYYLQKGPLVYAQPIDYEQDVIKTYDIDGFQDFFCLPTNLEDPSFKFDFEVVNPSILTVPNDKSFFNTALLVPAQGLDQEIDTNILFVPMAGTVLRQITFDE